jgi:catechol 2,3-dioxygenase-like lactoylglutathione lyase family enzyme
MGAAMNSSNQEARIINLTTAETYMTEAGKAPKVERLDHYALPAADLARAKKFYTEVLFGKYLGDAIPAVLDGIFIKLGKNHMGLFSQRKSSIQKAENLASYPRCAFVVPAYEFDRLLPRIKSSSSLVEEFVAEKSIAGWGNRAGVVFTDSEENVLELIKGNTEEVSYLGHIHFETPNLDASRKFFGNVLGLSTFQESENIAVMGVSGNQAIVLHGVPALSEVAQTFYREKHFAFYITDDEFPLVVAKIRGLGIKESDDIAQGVPREAGDLQFYFQDSTTGLHLQLTNRDSTYFAEVVLQVK